MRECVQAGSQAEEKEGKEGDKGREDVRLCECWKRVEGGSGRRCAGREAEEEKGKEGGKGVGRRKGIKFKNQEMESGEKDTRNALGRRDKCDEIVGLFEENWERVKYSLNW